MVNKKEVISVLKNLSQNKPCFCSEADFRESFCRELLKLNKNLILYPEFSPTTIPDSYKLSHHINFDLVSIDKKTKEITIFEFKYKTKKYTYKDEYISYSLCNQNDTTFGRYGFWKDIHRLEAFILTTESFSNGFIIFVTNNSSYISITKPQTDAYDFSLSQGIHKKGIKKFNKSKVKCFEIINDYDFNYNQYSDLKKENGIFKFCCIEVIK